MLIKGIRIAPAKKAPPGQKAPGLHANQANARCPSLVKHRCQVSHGLAVIQDSLVNPVIPATRGNGNLRQVIAACFRHGEQHIFSILVSADAPVGNLARLLGLEKGFVHFITGHHGNIVGRHHVIGINMLHLHFSQAAIKKLQPAGSGLLGLGRLNLFIPVDVAGYVSLGDEKNLIPVLFQEWRQVHFRIVIVVAETHIKDIHACLQGWLQQLGGLAPR